MMLMVCPLSIKQRRNGHINASFDPADNTLDFSKVITSTRTALCKRLFL